MTPKWEYFSACSFLQTTGESNNETSCQLPSAPAPAPEVVFEGTLEGLLEGDIHVSSSPQFSFSSASVTPLSGSTSGSPIPELLNPDSPEPVQTQPTNHHIIRVDSGATTLQPAKRARKLDFKENNGDLSQVTSETPSPFIKNARKKTKNGKDNRFKT